MSNKALINLAVSAGRQMAQNHLRAAKEQHRLNIRIEREQRQYEKEILKQEKEDAIARAVDETVEAEELRQEFLSILKNAIKSPQHLNWAELKDTQEFFIPLPQKPIMTSLIPEIDKNLFKPNLGFFDVFLKKRRKNKIQKSEIEFQKAIEGRLIENTRINDENLTLQNKHADELSNWRIEKEEFLGQQQEYNQHIDKLEKSYNSGIGEGIEFYFDKFIDSIEFPDQIYSSHSVEYCADSKILVIDFDLPEVNIIPNLKSMKYISTRREFTEKYLTDKEISKIYEDILFQICLRTTNDIYVSDTSNLINSIVFNGIHRGVSKSIGKVEIKCIMSLHTNKNTFLELNLTYVEPRLCFNKLKGISGSKLSELVPIAPILSMNKLDRRFVGAVNVAHTINDKNLASMDWESFEHLIRELFEKEFAQNGAEVKITRASRDGGVDAIMFDPDPIRGGKYVIQAKRYTNLVGVSAVRDLFGSLMNEGAVKGILVTTADYGNDSYEFAKDKPITLINGSNLLYMLKKHGYHARIDLQEAKNNLKNLQ